MAASLKRPHALRRHPADNLVYVIAGAFAVLAMVLLLLGALTN